MVYLHHRCNSKYYGLAATFRIYLLSILLRAPAAASAFSPLTPAPAPSTSFHLKHAPANRHWPCRIVKGRSTLVTSFLTNDGKRISPKTGTSSSVEDNNYNDDLFGFVFLGGIVGAKDPVFAGVFLFCSAVAATLTRQRILPATYSIPAAVAGVTLLTIMAVHESLPELSTQALSLAWLFNAGGTDQTAAAAAAASSGNDNAAWIEVGLCLVSMAYGFGRQITLEGDKD